MGLVYLGMMYLGGRIDNTSQLLLLDPLGKCLVECSSLLKGIYAFHACPSPGPTFAFFSPKLNGPHAVYNQEAMGFKDLLLPL